MPILGGERNVSYPKDVPGETLSEEQLKVIFKQHDKNGDGRLDLAELMEAFQRLGAAIPVWRAWRGLKNADADGDGYVTESEMTGLAKYAVQYGYTVSS